MTKTASCACARATITVTGEPVLHGVCHCTNCKQRTGSAFGISAYFPRTAVVGSAGDTNTYAFRSVQDHDQSRHFCTHCGTTLYWTLSALPELVGIAGGCFGEADLGEPTTSVTHSKKVGWVGLPETWRIVDR